ncbi:unnamed protein product, partial [Linum tenue]
PYAYGDEVLTSSSYSRPSPDLVPLTDFRPAGACLPVILSTDPDMVGGLRSVAEADMAGGLRSKYGEAAATAAVEDVDVEKLGIALSHSSVLVSVFCKPRDVGIRDQEEEEKGGDGLMGLGDVLQRLIPPALMISPSNGQLVGFGRAVSDSGLTASIHDVVVVPQLRGMGIGKMILQKITRILISRDIYDIAALCSANERSFFKACGFGDDILGSTTMMYTRTAPTCDNAGGDYQNHMAKRVGRKLLLIPPPRELPSLKVTVGESAED